jgi:hypothetical protein
MDQFAAADFRGDFSGLSASTPNPNVGWENPAILAASHFHPG